MGSIAQFIAALNPGSSEYVEPTLPSGVWQVNLETIVDGSHNASELDTLQVFKASLIETATHYNLYYIGNSGSYVIESTGDDIDQVFLAQKSKSDGQPWNKGWTKRKVSGLVSPVLTPGAFGTFEEGQVYGWKIVIEAGVFRLYYTGINDGSPSYIYKAGVATSTDGVNFTKHISNPIFDDGLNGPVNFVPVKYSPTKWYAVYRAGNGSIRLAESTDGLTGWTYARTLTLSNITFITDILKIGTTYYLYGYGNVAAGDSYNFQTIKCFSTTDFSTFTDRGVQITRFIPAERGVGHTSVIQTSVTRFKMIYTYYKYRQRPERDALTNPYTAIKSAELSHTVPYSTSETKIFPSYLKKYYPLYGQSTVTQIKEWIAGTTVTAPWTPTYSADVKFLIPSGSHEIEFPAEVVIANPNNFAVKVRVGQGLTGVHPVVCQDDPFIRGWYITVDNGILEVGISSTGEQIDKLYRTVDIIERDQDLRDVYQHCWVGFIYKNGVLRLLVEDNIGANVDKVLDNPMTGLYQANLPIKFLEHAGVYSTNQIRGCGFMSGMTDVEYINYDL